MWDVITAELKRLLTVNGKPYDLHDFCSYFDKLMYVSEIVRFMRLLNFKRLLMPSSCNVLKVTQPCIVHVSVKNLYSLQVS